MLLPCIQVKAGSIIQHATNAPDIMLACCGGALYHRRGLERCPCTVTPLSESEFMATKGQADVRGRGETGTFGVLISLWGRSVHTRTGQVFHQVMKTISTFKVVLVISASFALTATAQPACVSPPSGLVGWWRGEGNGNDSAGTNNAYSMPNVRFTKSSHAR